MSTYGDLLSNLCLVKYVEQIVNFAYTPLEEGPRSQVKCLGLQP